MPQIEWFYAKNDQPCGPVSPVELKQFAERGELHEHDLVWREGLGEWIPAGKVKGLFDSNGERGSEGGVLSEAESAGQDSPAGGEVPARAIPNPPPPAAELPVRAALPMFGHQAEEPGPILAKKGVLEPEAESRALRHPLDALADLARGQFDARFVHSTVVLFRLGGQVGIFLAIIALLSLAAAVGATTGNTAIDMPLAAAGVVALLLMQYGATHIFSAAEKLDCNVRAWLSATGPLDSLAAFVTVLGLVLLLGLGGLAMSTSTAWPAFLAIASFIVCQFTAIVAWNPRAVGLDISATATPGHEAGAQLCLLGKLLWRLSAVGYGAGILLGSIAVLNVAVHIGLPGEVDPRWFDAEMHVPLGLLAAAVPLPVMGYVAFLVCQYLGEVVLEASERQARR